MNREEVSKEIQAIKSNNILLELATGFGKTLEGIKLIARNNPKSVLILAPRLSIIESWKKEFKKWGYEELLKVTTFSTYISLRKYANMSFTTICFDEAHHISERVIEVLETIDRKYNVLLSATITRSKKQELQLAFPNLFTYSIKLKEAIDNNVLPDPLVYLIPYYLDNTNRDILLTLKSSKKGKGVTCDYIDRWKYLKDKSYTTIIVKCTQLEAINELSNKIEYLKRMYMRSHNEAFKNKWLQMAGQRLKMLGNFKTSIVLNLQVLFKNQRCLTFCNSIEQTEQLGRYCINSSNKDSLKLIDKFNEGKINHITSCNMLSEGINLVNCRIGIFASLNSSEILIAQKNGRLLRHESPVLIIPYYKNTREEEIVSKMLENYNPELVETVESLNQIKV